MFHFFSVLAYTGPCTVPSVWFSPLVITVRIIDGSLSKRLCCFGFYLLYWFYKLPFFSSEIPWHPSSIVIEVAWADKKRKNKKKKHSLGVSLRYATDISLSVRLEYVTSELNNDGISLFFFFGCLIKPFLFASISYTFSHMKCLEHIIESQTIRNRN